MWGEREKSPKERSSEAGRTLDTDQGRITSTSLIFSLTNLLENLQDVSLEPIKPIKNHISPGAGIPRGGCSSFLLPWSQESTTRPLDFVFYLQTRGFCIFKCVKQDEKTGINITESHQSIHIIIKKNTLTRHKPTLYGLVLIPMNPTWQPNSTIREERKHLKSSPYCCTPLTLENVQYLHEPHSHPSYIFTTPSPPPTVQPR